MDDKDALYSPQRKTSPFVEEVADPAAKAVVSSARRSSLRNYRCLLSEPPLQHTR